MAGNLALTAGVCSATMPFCAGVAIIAGALIVGLGADIAFEGIF